MALTEKAQIYKYVWQCAYQRRYNAKIKEDWNLYEREHQTILMCLNMRDAKWTFFESDKKVIIDKKVEIILKNEK